MALVLASTGDVDSTAFDGLSELMKRRISASASCIIDSTNNDFVHKFDAKVYIPENVRIDEKLPRSTRSYFVKTQN